MNPIDFSDRINAVTINISPRLLYLFQSLPIVPLKQCIEWDKMISRFSWDGRKPRVRYTTLQLTKK
uniref:Uncharacterized protein n=1 Tax=Anguilla anguilla TaxID=7936 RepID=A0A0E9SII4_ANGAN